MKIKILITGILVLAGTSLLNAQELKFDKDLHNFGKLPPNAATQTHTYEFTNTGDKALKIKNVQPSCGCTASDWTKNSIQPGEKGKVKISFDPKERAGYQQNDVKIITNAKNSPHFVIFEAYIKEKPTKPKASLDYDFGSLSLNTDFLDFGNLPLGTKRQMPLKLKNDGDSTVTIQKINTPGDVTSYPTAPFELAPRQSKILKFTLFSKGSPTEMGIYKRDISIQSSEYPKQPYPITAAGILYPNIPEPAANEASPKISFKKETINFGKLGKGAGFKGQFHFENKGKAVLTVYKVESGGCSCTTPSDYSNEKIKPGEEDQIRVDFDSESLEGPVDKKIYVFTNDPDNPLKVLSIKGTIEP